MNLIWPILASLVLAITNADAQSVSAEQRISGIFQIALQIAEENPSPLSQEKLQEIIGYVHQARLTWNDLVNLKNKLLNSSQFLNLNYKTEADLQTILQDLIQVRGRMDFYENFWHLHCRFALTPNPYQEVSADSVIKNPEKFRDKIPDELIKTLQQDKHKRVVIGLCWRKTTTD